MLFDFSTNLDPNKVIFDFVDFSMSIFSKITKIYNFSPQLLVQFLSNLKNTLENILILRGYDFYSLLYYLIRDYNLKLVSLEIILISLHVL